MTAAQSDLCTCNLKQSKEMWKETSATSQRCSSVSVVLSQPGDCAFKLSGPADSASCTFIISVVFFV